MVDPVEMSHQAHSNLRKNVRRLRKAESWTRETLAKQAKIGLRTLERIEDGEEGGTSPKLDTVIRIAAALGVTVDALLATPPPRPRSRG